MGEKDLSPIEVLVDTTKPESNLFKYLQSKLLCKFFVDWGIEPGTFCIARERDTGLTVPQRIIL
jgi:hypothetical protein